MSPRPCVRPALSVEAWHRPLGLGTRLPALLAPARAAWYRCGWTCRRNATAKRAEKFLEDYATDALKAGHVVA